MLTLLQVKSGFLKFTDSFASKLKHPGGQLVQIQHNVSHKEGKTLKNLLCSEIYINKLLPPRFLSGLQQPSV